MAGTAVKVIASIASVPLQKFVTAKLESSWRSATGTEPPSMQRRKEQEKANKVAKKMGLLPRPIEEPKFTDSLMWTALTAMSIVGVKYAAERGAHELHRFFVGSNPKAGSALTQSTAIAQREAAKANQAV